MIRVYKYGLLPPTENADVVMRQMKLAHGYQNKLIELERARRAEVRSAMSKYGNMGVLEKNVQDCKEAVEKAKSAINKQRSSTRSRSENAGDKERLAEARDNLRHASYASF